MFKNLLLFLLLIVFPIVANAHLLKENSATVTLRDGQVEVRLLVDSERWKNILKNSESWLMGDTNEVMKSGLSDKEELIFLQNLLIKYTHIQVNNLPITLKIMHSTKTPEKMHKGYIEFILLGKHTQSDITQLAIQFPKSLNRVHTNIVQPKYQLIQAGKKKVFSF